MEKAIDTIQQRIASYAYALNYDALSPEVIHACKVRIIDTLGALIAGFFAEPCRMARAFAAQRPDLDGATVIGTRMKTTLDMAAFANGTAQRYAELTDTYHWPGSVGGHPSDVLTPVLSAAEYARVSGRELISAIVLAYEIHLRINDVFQGDGFDHTNLCCLATAVASGKLMGLSTEQLSQAIAMSIVPNVALRVARIGHQSMWKVLATGQAGRAGVFAAMLARAGMEGPHLPFEGVAGWCDHVAAKRFTLETLGGEHHRFKMLDTSIKLRPVSALVISSILAAERLAPFDIGKIKTIEVEVYKRAKDGPGSGDQTWNPTTTETAGRSIPYVVAAALMDGTITLKSFDDAHFTNAELRALMQKITVLENPEFTAAYGRLPVEHRTRITIVTHTGECCVGEAGGQDDLSGSKSDEQIVQKFRALTQDYLSTSRVDHLLERLWNIDKIENVAEIPPSLVVA